LIRIPEEIIEIALGRRALLLFFCAASLGFKWSVFSLWFRMQAKGEGILDALARGSIILSAHTARSRLVLLTSPELVIGHVDYIQSKCTLNSPSSSSRDP